MLVNVIFENLDTTIEPLKGIYNIWQQGESNRAAEMLHDYYRTKPTVAFLTEPEKVLSMIKSQLDPQIKEVADQLLDNCFIFNEPWDMEKCQIPVIFDTGKIDWQHVEAGDDEWMFMINRHHFFVKLIQEYFATEDIKYYNQLENMLLDWMEKEPNYHGREGTSWRSIDTGLRLKNWVLLFEYLRHCPHFSQKLCFNMILFIQRQLAYLEGIFSPELSLSNWRILEFHGAYIAASYFDEFSKSEFWQQQALDIICTCLPLQVTNDGFHWEQSFMYHHEVLLCSMELLLIMQRQNKVIPRTLVDTVEKMARASSHLITPSGKQICYGDSDIESMSDLITLCQVVFPEINFGKFVDQRPSFRLITHYGASLLDVPGKVDRSPLEQLDFVHEDVGNYFVRSGWEETDNFLFFKNGFLGSGHGHNDLLHIDLIIEGVPVLVDSGRYTYNPNDPKRQFYKSTKAHNTVLVDDKEFNHQKRAWATTKVANEVKRPVKVNQRVVFLQGAHLGYIDQQILINRKIIWIKPDIWLIVDEGYTETEQTHDYQHFFHFNTKDVFLNKNHFSYLKNKLNVKFTPIEEVKIEKKKCLISPAYNQEYESDVVILRKQTKGRYLMEVLITNESNHKFSMKKIPVFDMNHRKISSENITGLKISESDRDWIICINHKEEDTSRKLYLVDDTPVYGRTIVIEKEQKKVINMYNLEY